MDVLSYVFLYLMVSMYNYDQGACLYVYFKLVLILLWYSLCLTEYILNFVGLSIILISVCSFLFIVLVQLSLFHHSHVQVLFHHSHVQVLFHYLFTCTSYSLFIHLDITVSLLLLCPQQQLYIHNNKVSTQHLSLQHNL